MSRSVVERLFVWDKSNRSPRQENFGRPVVDRPANSTLILLFFLYLVSDHDTLGIYVERYTFLSHERSIKFVCFVEFKSKVFVKISFSKLCISG